MDDATQMGVTAGKTWGVMRWLMSVVATVLSCSVMANEVPPNSDPASVPERLRALGVRTAKIPPQNEALPGFDPASVPERLRALEGRIAYIKIPSQNEALLYALQGEALMGNVPAEVVAPANTTSIPLELASREREFELFFRAPFQKPIWPLS